MSGGTLEGQHYRTIDMLKEMTGKSEEDVMYILYFLYDLQYGTKDMKDMADLLRKD
ncbi:hypothetical protein [Bacillus phage SDFMU_Pbc]|uniref:Uncharacterized protein n=1 Tax=Bacillus phage SDFMU_Pbc TaxID=3076135 RepID=A0AA96R106_9CAUD|nr:hypothetical protein [Bacillus phage SDFMU_Pbc]